MIRYSCTQCQRTLLVKPTLAGQTSTCPCGATFTVPQAAKPAPTAISNTAGAATAKAKATQPASPDTSASLMVACTKCDRQLRAPKSAAGKAVRCPCGQLVMVPNQTKRGTTVVSVVRDEPGGEWLKQLPPPQVYQAPPPQSGAEFWYVDVEPEEYEPPPPVTLPDARQLSHEYIRGAEKELREQKRHGSGGALVAAQIILVLVGLISVAVNGFLYFNATNEVEQVMKSGNVVMSQESLLFYVQSIYGGFIAVGVTMILLGALIYQFPVFCPLAGLIIYILAIIVSAVIDPMSLIKGIIFKVLVIVALGKAVGDGASYRY